MPFTWLKELLQLIAFTNSSLTVIFAKISDDTQVVCQLFYPNVYSLESQRIQVLYKCFARLTYKLFCSSLILLIASPAFACA
jgi:hypothetical protein